MTTYNHLHQKVGMKPAGSKRPPLLSLRELADEVGISTRQMASRFANHVADRPVAQLLVRGATSNAYFVAADLRAWWKKVSS